MKPKKSRQHMVWLDMEMTGLNPERDNIIEIATVITDQNLNIVAEGPDLVIHQSYQKLAKMDQWNRRQHGKSGLIEEINRSKIGLREAERLTLQFIKKYCVKGFSPLCGNSIHHDKRFLIRYMPRIHRYLHYRIVDVSTVKALIERWYSKGCRFSGKKNVHRALADIRESIRELQFYREKFFRSSPL